LTSAPPAFNHVSTKDQSKNPISQKSQQINSKLTPPPPSDTPGMILWHLWTGAIAELIPLLGFELC
jgi:hypothetical protein